MTYLFSPGGWLRVRSRLVFGERRFTEGCDWVGVEADSLNISPQWVERGSSKERGPLAFRTRTLERSLKGTWVDGLTMETEHDCGG